MVDSRGLNVLIIEDDSADFQFITTKLENSDFFQYNFFHCKNLREVANYSQANTDLVLCDLNLSDSEGIETIVKIKRKFPQHPIIVISGQSERSLLKTAVYKEIQSYILKDELRNINLDKLILFTINEFQRGQNIHLKKQMDLIRVVTSEAAHQLNNSLFVLENFALSFPDAPMEFREKIQRISSRIKEYSKNMVLIAEDYKLNLADIKIDDFLKNINMNFGISISSEDREKIVFIDQEEISYAINRLISEYEITEGSLEVDDKAMYFKFVIHPEKLNYYSFAGMTFARLVLAGITHQHWGEEKVEGEILSIGIPLDFRSYALRS